MSRREAILSVKMRHFLNLQLSNYCILRRIMLFLAILISGGNMIIPRLPVLLLIFIIYFVYVEGRISISRKMLPLVACLCGIALISILNPYGADIHSFSIRYANFLVAFLILDVYLKSNPGLLKLDLYALLKFFPHQAILTVLFGTFLEFLFVQINSQYGTFYTFIGLFNYHTISGVTHIRPNGFFFEPGVFHIYINIYLLLALLVFKQKKPAFLAVVAVFFVQSTTGLIVLILILGYYFLQHYVTKGSFGNRIVKYLLSIFLLMTLLGAGWNNIEDKLYGESRGSFIARQYDTLTGVNIVISNPIFGIGFNYDSYYKAARTLGYQDTEMTEEGVKKRNNSNGIVMMFYNIGIPVGLLFLFGLYRQQLIDSPLLFCCIIFISLLTEALIFTPFFLIIIFSGLVTGRNRNKN